MATKLRELLKGLPSSLTEGLDPEMEITGITSDSREVRPGFVFVAVRGESQDGHAFIGAAQQAGAALIVCENGEGVLAPFMKVSSARLALARLASNFYGNPSHAMKMVAVTGTSGKTTVTYLIESVLREAGEKVGVIGTVNFRFGTKIYPSTHTTPGAVELQRLLAEMRADGCTAVVMEVSSHALKQQRVAFIGYDAMVFTNLSPEHLDYHPDMEDYYQSKAILFKGSVQFALSAGKKPVAVINADDKFGERLRRELEARPGNLRVLAYSLGEGDLSVGLDGISGQINGVEVRSPLIGGFNAYNVMSALAVGLGLGLPKAAISRGLTLPAVPGRLERVPNSRGVHVFVDYAHKSDALEKVLGVLREMRDGGRLICVFGCGGDRDRAKRPVMGKLASDLADQVVVTSDNPRTEEPSAIIAEIMAGISRREHVLVEPDRARAIAVAINGARQGDIVLIAGKGHEDYQILGRQKVHFDDREVAAAALLGD